MGGRTGVRSERFVAEHANEDEAPRNRVGMARQEAGPTGQCVRARDGRRHARRAE